MNSARGQVKLADSTNTSLSGSVVANTIEMSGSTMDLIADLDDDQGKAIYFLSE